MRRGSVLACSVALLGACVQVSDFDPVGGAASISGAWTIDGAPPSAAGCEALGASTVRVTFVDGLRPVSHGALARACNLDCMPDGALVCFDTRPSMVVAEGVWTIRLEALRGTEVVAASPELIYSTDTGHIALETASFLTGTISAAHTVGGSAPSFASCQEAGVDAVELSFEAAGGEVSRRAIEPCTVGIVGTNVAPGAAYTVRLRALGPTGAIVGESAAETFDIAPGQRAELNGGEPIELTAL